VTGVTLTVAVAVAAASIARGVVHYLTALLPITAPLLLSVIVVGVTAIAIFGVRASVGPAAVFGFAGGPAPIKGASRNDRNRMGANTAGSPCRRRGYAFSDACQGRHRDDR
jgi:hypothetical protein